MTTTIGDAVAGETCMVGRFVAPRDFWLGMGAVRASPGNGVEWGMGVEGDQRRGEALALLEEAAAECSAPSRIFPRALALYRAGAGARAQMALAVALTRLSVAITAPGALTVRHHADAVADAIRSLASR